MNPFAKIGRRLARNRAHRHLLALPEAAAAVYRRVRNERLTYLPDTRLDILTSQLRSVIGAAIEGAVLEAGCALGGSSLILCALKEPDRPMAIYDVFETIPPPTEEDGEDVWERYKKIEAGESEGLGGDDYYGYMDNLYEKVRESFHRFGLDPGERSLELVKGDVEETLRVDGAVAFAHIDVDWYRPVKVCLERIGPQLSKGGIVVLDDYDCYSGCRKATDEFLGNTADSFSADASSGPMILTKL